MKSIRRFIAILLGSVSFKYRARFFQRKGLYLWETYVEDSKRNPYLFKPLTSPDDYRPNPHKGHQHFELDTVTGAIYYAEFEYRPKAIGTDGTLLYEHVVKIKPKHLYCTALNGENAKKIFRKQMMELKNIVQRNYDQNDAE